MLTLHDRVTSIIPTMLMPLSWLSYASALGILSTFLIVAVIFIDGFSIFESPGSLWVPAETSFSVRSLGELGVSFGLFMAGVSLYAFLRLSCVSYGSSSSLLATL